MTTTPACPEHLWGQFSAREEDTRARHLAGAGAFAALVPLDVVDCAEKCSASRECFAFSHKERSQTCLLNTAAALKGIALGDSRGWNLHRKTAACGGVLAPARAPGPTKLCPVDVWGGFTEAMSGARERALGGRGVETASCDSSVGCARACRLSPSCFGFALKFDVAHCSGLAKDGLAKVWCARSTQAGVASGLRKDQGALFYQKLEACGGAKESTAQPTTLAPAEALQPFRVCPGGVWRGFHAPQRSKTGRFLDGAGLVARWSLAQLAPGGTLAQGRTACGKACYSTPECAGTTLRRNADALNSTCLLHTVAGATAYLVDAANSTFWLRRGKCDDGLEADATTTPAPKDPSFAFGASVFPGFRPGNATVPPLSEVAWQLTPETTAECAQLCSLSPACFGFSAATVHTRFASGLAASEKICRHHSRRQAISGDTERRSGWFFFRKKKPATLSVAAPQEAGGLCAGGLWAGFGPARATMQGVHLVGESKGAVARLQHVSGKGACATMCFVSSPCAAFGFAHTGGRCTHYTAAAAERSQPANYTVFHAKRAHCGAASSP